jgi:glutamine synthetase
MAGAELEFYLFHETYSSARAKHYHDLETMGAYVEDYHILAATMEEPLVGEIRRALEASGIPVECSKGEWGPGQHELNLRYSEALMQADSTIVHKHAAKEIAHAQGKALTYMAKWDERFAGSSMHLHVSLRNAADGTSAFPGEVAIGPVRASETFRWFLGGWLAAAADLTAFYAPYVASYKRYQAGSFAPTAIAWSHDNRTTGFRIVGSGDSLRIECRIAGADANPYLALAASLAAGLDGIARRADPPPLFAGDAYSAADLPRVPPTLRHAIDALQQSTLAREAFGAEVVEHYLHFYRTEQRKFDEVVTCWERARFFERV